MAFRHISWTLFFSMVILTTGSKECGRPADIVFLIDTSRSIWPPHFTDQLQFIQSLVQLFDISPEKIRVGAVSFSNGYREEFKLNTYSTKGEVIQAINRTYFTKGDTTDTFDALTYLHDVMFREENGARAGIPHIAIVITDGRSADPGKTLKEANIARMKGIQIFAIGVGFRIDFAELSGIASLPISDFRFTVNSFPELKNIRFLLVYQACSVPVKMTTTPEQTPGNLVITTTETPQLDIDTALKACGGKPADVVFVLDISSSIYIKDFETQLTFVSDVIDIFDIGPDKTQVGVVTFSSNASVKFYLNEFHSKADIQAHVASVEYTGGKTATSDALRMVKDEVLSEKHGYRPSVAHIVIVVTDGLSQDPYKTEDVAAELKKRGTYLFAIGVGNDTDPVELEAVGSSPATDFVSQVDGYDALKTIKNLLAFKTCEVKPSTKPQSDQLSKCQAPVPADIMFVTDLKYAGGRDVTKTLDLIKHVSQGLDVGKSKTHVGLVSNHCPNISSIELNEHYYTSEFSRALDNIKFTNMTSLLETMRRKLTVSREGAQPSAKKVAVLFVSGPISDMKTALAESMRAKFKGVTILAVGVGPQADASQLGKLASKPGKKIDMTVFRNGQNLSPQILLNKICKGLQ